MKRTSETEAQASLEDLGWKVWLGKGVLIAKLDEVDTLVPAGLQRARYN